MNDGSEDMSGPGGAPTTTSHWKCVVVGHRIRFRSQGRTMSWSCEWCGGRTGSKTYESAAAATKYARAFDRRDSADAGRRAPILGMFPLRLWRLLRRRQESAA